jgi:alpha-galactosidase
MSEKKISIIGAGSAVFSLILLRDLCSTEGISGSTISLMDINKERLDVVYRLASRCAYELSADIKFEKTDDLQRALTDADFVINTAYVIGHGYAKAIREVGAKHGYYYYRDPYNTPEPGPPALSNFSQLQLTLSVAREMERVCPDAYLLQAANPVFEGCTLVARETEIKVCGVCHGHLGYRDIARTIGLNPNKVYSETPGLNHCIWLTHFYYEGKDAYSLIDEWIKTKAEQYWRTHSSSDFFDTQMSRAAVNQYHLYGLFPIGDTVRGGGWWYHTNKDAKRHWYGEPWGGPDTEECRTAYVSDLSNQVKEIKRITEDDKHKVTDSSLLNIHGEQHISIIDAIVNDRVGKFQVNVPNHGAIEGLPDDVIVEVPAEISKKGIKPIHVGRLPKKVMLEQIIPRWLAMEHVLETFKSGSKSMLLWEILQHHQTRSYEDAENLLEDLLSLPESAEASTYYR